jgi:hypothetical protein
VRIATHRIYIALGLIVHCIAAAMLYCHAAHLDDYAGAAPDRQPPASTLLHSALRLFDSPLLALSSPPPPQPLHLHVPLPSAGTTVSGGGNGRTQGDNSVFKGAEAASIVTANPLTSLTSGLIRPPTLLDTAALGSEAH